jgi:hypothetical protein
MGRVRRRRVRKRRRRKRRGNRRKKRRKRKRRRILLRLWPGCLPRRPRMHPQKVSKQRNGKPRVFTRSEYH